MGSIEFEVDDDTVNVTSCITVYSYAKCNAHSMMPISMPASSPCKQSYSTSGVGEYRGCRMRRQVSAAATIHCKGNCDHWAMFQLVDGQNVAQALDVAGMLLQAYNITFG
jgi:hypothetical protein